MADELTTFLARIRNLLHEQADVNGVPSLAKLEDTLTDGYAHALALEGERARIAKQIAGLAARIEGEQEALELRRLAERLAHADRDLAELRRSLRALRERTDLARPAVPGRLGLSL